jgi:hypothetical protein
MAYYMCENGVGELQKIYGIWNALLQKQNSTQA